MLLLWYRVFLDNMIFFYRKQLFCTRKQVSSFNVQTSFFRSHYAVGAPKNNLGRGAVYICHSCFDGDHDKTKNMKIECSENLEDENFCSFGSRFGQAVAAVNIDNSKGKDELVVGAPLHSSSNNYDTGAVFVYEPKKDAGIWTLKKLKSFKSPESLTRGCRFGSAVENLGDIHNDGYEDFAVSAPYLENQSGKVTGAVFVYRGTEDLDDFNGKFLIFKGFLCLYLNLLMRGTSLLGEMSTPTVFMR